MPQTYTALESLVSDHQTNGNGTILMSKFDALRRNMGKANYFNSRQLGRLVIYKKLQAKHAHVSYLPQTCVGRGIGAYHSDTASQTICVLMLCV
jgi:hypothetical protein